jgi:hypothetical protein
LPPCPVALSAKGTALTLQDKGSFGPVSLHVEYARDVTWAGAGAEPGIEYRGAMYSTKISKPYQVVVTYIMVIYICFTNLNK